MNDERRVINLEQLIQICFQNDMYFNPLKEILETLK